MIKGAIFDVDGVILDSMEIWMDAGARYLQSMKIEAEPGLGETLWMMSIPEGAAYLKKRYRMEVSEKEIIQGVLGTIRDFYYYEAPLKAGVKRFLESLSQNGVPMAIASSGEKEYIRRAFERLGIWSYFRGIVTPIEAGAGKTEPMIYRMAAGFTETEPCVTYVFEDALHAVRTANAVGFQTVGIYDRFSEKDQAAIRREAKIYLPDLTDFEKFWARVADL